MATVPWEIIQSEYKRRVASMGKGKTGRKRSCGHVEFVRGCPICERAERRQQQR